MKTLHLSCEYKRLSQLSIKDRYLFRKLLKGISDKRYLIELCIIPVSVESELTCHGFAIERHQLFRSETSGQYYLVFLPRKYKQLTNGGYPYSHYFFVNDPDQPGYICLMRRKHDVHTQYLGGVYSILQV